jgi:hypothetical protein
VAINKNWARWIISSIQKYVNDNRQGISLFVEGTPRNTRTLKDFMELRIDGPSFTEISKNYWLAVLDINIFVQSTQDETNFHRIYTNIGTVSSILTDMLIYKYGSGVDDDDSLLGCLQLVQDAQGRKPIQVAFLGKIKPEVPIVQAIVEGNFKMNLDV